MNFICAKCGAEHPSTARDLRGIALGNVTSEEMGECRQGWLKAYDLWLANLTSQDRESYERKLERKEDEYFRCLPGSGVPLVPNTLVTMKRSGRNQLECRPCAGVAPLGIPS